MIGRVIGLNAKPTKREIENMKNDSDPFVRAHGHIFEEMYYKTTGKNKMTEKEWILNDIKTIQMHLTSIKVRLQKIEEI